jgi:hypothetical protein
MEDGLFLLTSLHYGFVSVSYIYSCLCVIIVPPRPPLPQPPLPPPPLRLLPPLPPLPPPPPPLLSSSASV